MPTIRGFVRADGATTTAASPRARAMGDGEALLPTVRRRSLSGPFKPRSIAASSAWDPGASVVMKRPLDPGRSSARKSVQALP